MTGPYEYVPPDYWLLDSQAGGAFGYNTETSPGEAIPPLESLRKFIPADHLWPVDDYWNYHAGGERFTTIKVFTDALSKRYGAPTDLNDFLRKSQLMTYDGERAMFEAYGRNKYTSTGVIQWMLNNAWPSLIWHLYDYYLVPAGGYFGTKKATETAHVQYSYDNNSVAVVNGYDHPLNQMKVTASAYNLDAKQTFTRDVTLDIAADASVKAMDLPAPTADASNYFLRLDLRDASGKQISNNFYALSSKQDVLDFAKKKDTVYTPQAEFADFTGLNNLPTIHLVARQHMVREGDRTRVEVTLQNNTNSVAFMAHLRLTQGHDGEDVVPIFWEDNYVSLIPGEKRTITGAFDPVNLNGKQPTVWLDGWNVTNAVVPLH
jgi:exo-1,4-beta-D-glucosaminidase